ncbi:MAG: META domain-containing protein [Bacteroidia bacterium]
MTRLFLCLPLLGTLLLIACKPPEPLPVGGELNLLHKDWTLVELAGDVPPADWDAMTLDLTNSASAGVVSSCNFGGGDYSANSEGAFTISAIALTKRGCISDERSDWEMRYIEALQNASRFGVDSETLYLWHESTLMRFE